MFSNHNSGSIDADIDVILATVDADVDVDIITATVHADFNTIVISNDTVITYPLHNNNLFGVGGFRTSFVVSFVGEYKFSDQLWLPAATDFIPSAILVISLAKSQFDLKA